MTDDTATIGHNSDPGFKESAERLRNLVERIERLALERKALGDDIRDIFTEARSAGFDPKVMRIIINLRSKEPAEVAEQRNLTDLYLQSLGME